MGAYRAAFGTAVSPRALFMYCYAVLYSPSYRQRYNEILIREFPRIPRPVSAKLFIALADAGERLVSAHLLKGVKAKNRLHGLGDGVVAAGMPKFDAKNGRISINAAQYFHPVSHAVWAYRVGSYEVCKKWLSERKETGLSSDDIVRFSQVLDAIDTTLAVQRHIDDVIDQHGGWPGAFEPGEGRGATAQVLPFRPRTVEPKPGERYATCVPLVPLKAAAGAFGDPQHIESQGFEWAEIESRHRLRPGMFVAQVVGKSMEPAIPDGAWCLFSAPVEGTRQGKTVLVQLRDTTDPDTGQRYTVKRYESEKAAKGDSWRHERITLKPINPDFKPIVLKSHDQGELQVVAELVEVLGRKA